MCAATATATTTTTTTTITFISTHPYSKNNTREGTYNYIGCNAPVITIRGLIEIGELYTDSLTQIVPCLLIVF